MSRLVHSLALFLLIFSLNGSFAESNSYYCDFGLCQPDQYCCADGKCCTKLLDLWYFWFGIVLIVLVVALVIFFKFYLRKITRDRYAAYSRLQQAEQS